MAKTRIQFICQACGSVIRAGPASAMPAASGTRWSRKARAAASAADRGAALGAQGPAGGADHAVGEIEDAPRIATGIGELDRATGGGFVRGSALLVGGDPGIGKSTLLMQAAAALAARPSRRLRLRRRGGGADPAARAAAGRGRCAGRARRRDQCRGHPRHARRRQAAGSRRSSIRSRRCGPTSPNRRRARSPRCAPPRRPMIRYAKSTGAAVVLVGHVTKEGQIAGPRVVEHMVDAVLYFEGEGGHHFRILRTVKNRFGPTDEIGVFEMSDRGLREVANPSELFLGERSAKAPGRGGVRRHGGHAAGAGRDPGAGGAVAARHAAPRRRRLGRRAAVHGARRARGALRRALRPARRLSQRRRRLSHQPSRRPIWRLPRRWCRPSPVLPFPPIASISAKSAFPARSGRWRMRIQRLKEAEKLGFGQAVHALRHGRTVERDRSQRLPASRR